MLETFFESVASLVPMHKVELPAKEQWKEFNHATRGLNLRYYPTSKLLVGLLCSRGSGES